MKGYVRPKMFWASQHEIRHTHYCQEEISLGLVLLLDTVLQSTSRAAMHPWCFAVTATTI